jgi:hypothetical protein
MSNHLKFTVLFFLFALSYIVPNRAHAVKILVIKDDKILLQFDTNESFKIGDVFSVDEGSKKSVAEIKIKAIKGQKILGTVSKGNLSGNKEAYILIPVKLEQQESITTQQATAKASPDENSRKPFRIKSPHSWGGFLGFAQNKMNVKLTGVSSVDLSGTSYSLEGFYQQSLDDKIEVLARFGYDTLKVQGASKVSGVCNGSPCLIDNIVDISYLDLDLVVKYMLYTKSPVFWAGAGLGFLYPIDKNSNLIDTGKIGLQQKIILSGGVDFKFTERSFIPLQLDFTYFPESASMNTSQLILRVGYGLKF